MSAAKDFARGISSLDPVFEFLAAQLAPHDLDEKTALGINLAVEEIFVNMVEHNTGTDAAVSIEIDFPDGQIRIRLTDHDVEPFDPDTVAPVDVTLPVEQRRPGGLGLHLVKSFVDKLSYEYENREMRVTLIKRLEPIRA